MNDAYKIAGDILSASGAADSSFVVEHIAEHYTIEELMQRNGIKQRKPVPFQHWLFTVKNPRRSS